MENEVVVPSNKWWTGVGSRDTPTEILALMYLVGRVFTDFGWRLRSGGARGADTAFYEGARWSELFQVNTPQIYLAWNGVFNGITRHWEDSAKGYFDASKFAKWKEAEQIALDTRGSWARGKDAQGNIIELDEKGKALHTRNVFQILGEHLDNPSKFLICWAPPVGKRGLTVRGGTNTAWKLAKKHGIKCINLAVPEDYNKVLDFLDRHQVEHPFERIAA